MYMQYLVLVENIYAYPRCNKFLLFIYIYLFHIRLYFVLRFIFANTELYSQADLSCVSRDYAPIGTSQMSFKSEDPLREAYKCTLVLSLELVK